MEKKFLLIRHSYGGKTWSLPGGGIKRNENREKAFIREVQEETQLEIKKVKEIGTYYTEAQYKKDTVYLYTADAMTSECIIDGKEIMEASWFTRETIPNEVSSLVRRVFEILDQK